MRLQLPTESRIFVTSIEFDAFGWSLKLLFATCRLTVVLFVDFLVKLKIPCSTLLGNYFYFQPSRNETVRRSALRRRDIAEVFRPVDSFIATMSRISSS